VAAIDGYDDGILFNPTKREETMTMIPLSTNSEPLTRQICVCCGRPIRLLDRQDLALFIKETSLHRRAFQCINCGDVICRECRNNGALCVCGSNAWLARPYLGDAGGDPGLIIRGEERRNRL
jgi:hypothetical protein